MSTLLLIGDLDVSHLNPIYLSNFPFTSTQSRGRHYSNVEGGRRLRPSINEL